MKPHWNPFDWLKDKGRGEIQLIGSTVIRRNSGLQTLIGSGSPIYKLFVTGRLIFFTAVYTRKPHFTYSSDTHWQSSNFAHSWGAKQLFSSISLHLLLSTYRNDGTLLVSGCVNMYIIKISDLWCEVTWAQGHSGNPNKFDLNWMWMWSQWRRSGGLCGLPSSGCFFSEQQCQHKCVTMSEIFMPM